VSNNFGISFSDTGTLARTRAENAGDDLGLSGPVVAAIESYWPAKSQVISGVNAMIPFI